VPLTAAMATWTASPRARAGSAQFEPPSSRPPVSSDGLMRGLDQILAGIGHEIAHDGRFTVDTRLHQGFRSRQAFQRQWIDRVRSRCPNPP